MGAPGFGAAEGAAIPGSMTGRAKPDPCPYFPGLRQSQVQILNGFVDFGVVLIAYGDCVDARISEGEFHSSLAVCSFSKSAFAHQLHADHAHAVFVHLLHMSHYFAYISQSVGVVVFRVHAHALVIHANHRYL
jgi:hypothetical protein